MHAMTTDSNRQELEKYRWQVEGQMGQENVRQGEDIANSSLGECLAGIVNQGGWCRA